MWTGARADVRIKPEHQDCCWQQATRRVHGKQGACPASQVADSSQNGRDHRMSSRNYVGTISKHDPPSLGDKTDDAGKFFNKGKPFILGRPPSLSQQLPSVSHLGIRNIFMSSNGDFLIIYVLHFLGLLMGDEGKEEISNRNLKSPRWFQRNQENWCLCVCIIIILSVGVRICLRRTEKRYSSQLVVQSLETLKRIFKTTAKGHGEAKQQDQLQGTSVKEVDYSSLKK